jgi:DNA (cytosine-5)-methyltransferase 1
MQGQGDVQKDGNGASKKIHGWTGMIASQKAILELFCGAGGLARGMENVGFEHLALVEWNNDACRTLNVNFDEDIVFNSDVREFDFSQYSGVDVISGGPPCQPFSIGGKHQSDNDERDMFPVATNAISEILPKAFVFENVKGLLRSSFSQYFQYIILQLTYPQFALDQKVDWKKNLKKLERLHTSGTYSGAKYNVIYRLLNAADYGVPQTRERVFIVGVRDDIGFEWSFPEKTHSLDTLLWSQYVTGEYGKRHKMPPPSTDVFDNRIQNRIKKVRDMFGLFPPADKPWRTVRDCLRDVPDPTPTPTRRGEHELRVGARIYPGHNGSLIDLPSKTLKAGDHGVPGGENMIRFLDGTVRYFTTYEAKLIQTFPKSYHITGSWTEAMRQIGNAVPVRLAQTIGKGLIEKLQSAKSTRKMSKFGR